MFGEERVHTLPENFASFSHSKTMTTVLEHPKRARASPKHSDGTESLQSAYARQHWAFAPGLAPPCALSVLRQEADALLTAQAGDEDEQPSLDALLAETGCSFDPMEAVIGTVSPTHTVRSDLQTYLESRFRCPGPLAAPSCQTAAHRAAFRDFLCGPLAVTACEVTPLVELLLARKLAHHDLACYTGAELPRGVPL